MLRSYRPSFLVLAGCLLVAATGCGPTGEDVESAGLSPGTALPARRGTVLVDGCVLDTWQHSTLLAASTRRVISEVIMLCLVPRLDGVVGPRDPSARRALAALAVELRAAGYRVLFGAAFTDESGQRYDGAQTAALLADAAWRNAFRETLPLAIEAADGVEIDLQFLPNGARAAVTALVLEVAPAMAGKSIGIFVPPSISEPSDLPGGDAFALRELGRHVQNVRVMTLDYSEHAPGPTIDPGWAVDAVRLAKPHARRVDIAFPLYAIDFGPRGRRSSSYLEAQALAFQRGSPPERGPTGAGFVRYVNAQRETHELWFDDASSTTRALGAWTYEALPADVGILFYGLGAEDPFLFDAIAERTP